MVGASEFICDTYIDILHTLMYVNKFGHVAYLLHLKGIFIDGTYIDIAR